MTRQAYVLDEHRVVVFWARKAACTSIVDAVLFDILGQDEADFGETGAKKRPWLKDHGYEADFVTAARRSHEAGFRSIGLIRDPYERLVSVYLNTFVRHEGVPVQRATDMAGFPRRFYAGITGQDTEDRAIAYDGLSYFDFVTAVCDCIDRRWTDALRRRGLALCTGRFRAARRRPRTEEPVLDPHWNTQVPFWFRTTGFRYDFLYSTAQSDAFFQKLSELAGVAISAKRLNYSHYAGPETRQEIPDLVRANPLTYADDPQALNKASFDSAELRRRVRRSFAPDYHYLRLCRS